MAHFVRRAARDAFALVLAVVVFVALPSRAGDGAVPAAVQASPGTMVPAVVPAASVRSLSLPAAWRVSKIEVVAGRPVLFVELGLSPDGSASQCALAFVNPTTLQVRAGGPAPCDAPLAYRAGAYPVSTWRHDGQVEVRIARFDATSGRVHLGPVVMTYTRLSGTGLVSTSGFGSLWVYDADTTAGAELLRVSSATGQVEDRVQFRVPVYRPVMAADSAGLWMGVSPGGAGGPVGSPVYFIANASTHPVVAWRGGRSDLWAVSDAGHVWVGVFSAGGGVYPGYSVVGFAGARARPVSSVTLRGAAAGWMAINNVVSGRGTLLTLSWPPSSQGPCASAALLSVNPNTGQVVTVARLPGPVTDDFDGCTGLKDGEAVAVGRRAFVLSGPQPGPGGGYTQLFVVNLPQPT